MELICGSLSQILPTVPQRGDIQSLQKIKPELSHIQLSETDKVGNNTSEKLQRLSLQDQQQHGRSRDQLMTLLKELELLEAPLAAQGQHKAKRLTQEDHIAAAITWWRGQTPRDPQEAVADTHKQIQSMEVDRTKAQVEETKHGVRELLKDQGTSTEEDSQIQFRDVAVITDLSVEEDLLKSLRKVEDMVAHVVMGSENWMKERIEAISMRVERALSRAETTESQLNALEDTISANTQSLCMSQSMATGILDCSSADITFFSTPQPLTQESALNPFSSKNGGWLLCTRAGDHSYKVSKNPTATLLVQDPGSPSELWLKRTVSVSSEPLSTGLPSVGAIRLKSPALLCPKSSLPEPSACEEPTPHNRQENVAGLDRPASSDSFFPESETSGSTSASNKETCRSPDKEEAGCQGTELQNSRGQTESSGRCQKSDCSGRTEALKLLNQGQSSKSADGWDNQGFSSSVEDTRRCQEETEESDCIGRSQEESVYSGKCQARTGHSETQEEPNTSDSSIDTSKSVQSADLTDTPGDQEDPSAVCQFTRSQGEQTPLKRAHSLVTESVTPFIFPHTRSRPPLTPAMPTLPEEEEDSPEELDSTSSSPTTYAPVESKIVNVTMTPPAIVLPRQVSKQDSCPLEKARPHSPRPRLSRNSASSCPITTVDDDGHVIDLVKDPLPELKLSEEDRLKNLELLDEAKKVSDRFLQRRGRRSTCSLSDSPTALSPNPTPCSSPRLSRSSSLSAPSQLGPEAFATPPASPSTTQHLEVPSTHDQEDTGKPEQETFTRLVEWMPSDKKKKVSSGTLTPRYATTVPSRDTTVVQKEKPDHHGAMDKGTNSEHTAQKKEETHGRGVSQPPATGVAKPVPRPPTQQAPCTAEIKTIGAFPPLMRAVSWDTVGSMNMRNAAPKGEESLSFPDKSRESLFKSSGYKDFPVPPGTVQKLSSLREEHKLVRNQSIYSSKLPDLSETGEQERGPPSPHTSSPSEEEKPDAMPNISDVMLRKLKLHRGLPGCAPPLSEKEVENAFVQLSLAFRNDNYTLESRLKQAERERNLTEENAEKELEEFKGSLKSTVSVWQNVELREFYQQLLETIAVLHRLTNRLSSRAEMVGAVRQEKRMNKATEVMMQYVENLKRTYEKDHAELMEFKKLANQNSNRCYGGSIDTGDDGVPRTSRSMSLQMGKALPRRRVSVAVVPKFNLLNVPGQTPVPAGSNIAPGALPVVCEANTIKNGSSSDPTQQDVPDKPGNPLTEQECEAMPTKVVCSPEKITEEIKAKIEEEAYNKGYQEGLKRSKELQELNEEEEKAEESEEESRGNTDKDRKSNSRFEEALEVIDRICPKFFRRNRVLWIVLTLFFASFVLVNVINFFSSRYSDSGDTSAEKSAIPGKKKFFGLNVGSKTPAPE
ncbi:inositol 1,4,5-triphosphate receptor associated 1 isoform X2 [Siphateles boraxobius]|uniref:inositol 1,4,5-triphosphate receptor associated 1 isoform X2 n=1 Tax=Siphateles boraxobius TaxID=180520 RepID=UPI0040633D3F